MNATYPCDLNRKRSHLMRNPVVVTLREVGGWATDLLSADIGSLNASCVSEIQVILRSRCPSVLP